MHSIEVGTCKVRELTVAVISALQLEGGQPFPVMKLFVHLHVAMVFGSPFTATRCRVLPYNTHAAFDPSILFSLRI
jgi:hypothetical protein